MRLPDLRLPDGPFTSVTAFLALCDPHHGLE